MKTHTDERLEFIPPPDWVYCETCKEWFPPTMKHHCWLLKGSVNESVP